MKIMNKKHIKVTLVAVVALISGINVFNAQKSESLSDIALANVEALADEEINEDCPNGCLDIIHQRGCWCYGWHQYEEKKWP